LPLFLVLALPLLLAVFGNAIAYVLAAVAIGCGYCCCWQCHAVLAAMCFCDVLAAITILVLAATVFSLTPLFALAATLFGRCCFLLRCCFGCQHCHYHCCWQCHRFCCWCCHCCWHWRRYCFPVHCYWRWRRHRFVGVTVFVGTGVPLLLALGFHCCSG